MKKVLFIAITSVFFMQCTGESVAPASAKVNFENLAVGQKSLYVAWESNNIWEENISFKQTTDTLSLTVVSQEEDGFKVEEKQFKKPDFPTYYYFKIKGDSLYIQPLPAIALYPASNVLFNIGSFKYILKDNNLPKLNINQWATPKSADIDIKITELFGKISNFKIMGKNYDSAFVYYDRSTITFDGPTITRIYTKKDGFISIQPIGGKTTFGRIYNLVP